jgi:uncharacterized protein (DUF2141 family)
VPLIPEALVEGEASWGSRLDGSEELALTHFSAPGEWRAMASRLAGKISHLKATFCTIVAATTLLGTSVSVADPPPTGVLTIRVSNLRSNKGQIGCTIYNSAKGFPTDPSAALQRRWCPIANAASTCAFDPILGGTYAVACFHDENNNGKCDTGLFGIPTEGTVVSNHAKGFMGAPSFDKAKFSFSGVASELQLRMGY